MTPLKVPYLKISGSKLNLKAATM